MKKVVSVIIAAAGLMLASGLALADGGPVTMLALNPLDFGLASLGAAGLVVNKGSLDRIFTGLKTVFHNALQSQTSDWMKTAMEVLSTSKGEDYAWLERFPAMRKWLGDKTIKNLKAGKYYVANEDYEATIAVDRNDIEDDSLGIYSTQTQMAGQSAAELHDTLIDDLKNGAFTNTCFDGQFFYDTDHPVNGASVSNKLTTALSAATAAAAADSYGAARQAMMEFTDEEGKPLRLVPNLLEVPPALETVARKLCYLDELDDGSDNPYKGTAEVLVNPALTSSTAWMLHCATRPVKPFIVQMRKRPEFVSQTSTDSDDVFMRREFKFGVEARAAGVYGFWQTSVGSTGA